MPERIKITRKNKIGMPKEEEIWNELSKGFLETLVNIDEGRWDQGISFLARLIPEFNDQVPLEVEIGIKHYANRHKGTEIMVVKITDLEESVLEAKSISNYNSSNLRMTEVQYVFDDGKIDIDLGSARTALAVIGDMLQNPNEYILPLQIRV